MRIEEADLNKEDGSIVSPAVKDGMITVEGEPEESAATVQQLKPAEPVIPAESVIQSPTTTITQQPEVKNNSEVMITPTQIEQDRQQEKAVETPALSWIVIIGIIVSVAIARRRLFN